MSNHVEAARILVTEPPLWARYCNYFGKKDAEVAILDNIRAMLGLNHVLGSTQASVYWRIDSFPLATLMKIVSEIELKGGQVVAVPIAGDPASVAAFFNFARVRLT